MLAESVTVLYNPPVMLTSTFVLLQGIGPVTERRFWEQGLLTWQHFVDHPSVPGISSERKAWYDRELSLAQAQFDTEQWPFFASRLPSRDHWRFYEVCQSRILYLDIETTGASAEHGHVTVVGLHRNGHTTSLIHGQTLTTDRLQDELDRGDLLVTFCGTGFDVPYLRSHFPRLRLNMPHFDLCFGARRLGLRGGLKQIEREVGIVRDASVRGFDGWDAVRLWSRWNASGDQDALDLLVAYNTADAANLEPLAKLLYADLSSRFGPASVCAKPWRPWTGSESPL